MRYMICGMLLMSTSELLGQEPAQPIWHLEQLHQPPKFSWVDAESPIRSLIFSGPEYEGKATEVFAFYATPGSVARKPELDKNLPAVVCLHGGGGTAFAEWVNLWAQRGYAAIALDFSGRRPSAPSFDPATDQLIIQPNHRAILRERLAHGGPEQGGNEKFQDAGGDLTDDWQHHAISNIMLAHSLIRSFPEINAERTAVTGISWGGYLTCLAASIDERFKAAVPVYGCGFLDEGESVQKPQIDRLPEETRQWWINNYDPSKHLVNCRVPILFVNGTNDVHYPLDSYMKSFRAVPGEKNLRIQVNMSHGHPPGWEPIEIELFIASKINAGQGLARISKPEIKNGIISAEFAAEVPVKEAALHWTTDVGLLSKRIWHSSSLTKFQPNLITAPQPPAESTIWYLTVTDERGAMTSSEVIFVEPR